MIYGSDSTTLTDAFLSDWEFVKPDAFRWRQFFAHFGFESTKKLFNLQRTNGPLYRIPDEVQCDSTFARSHPKCNYDGRMHVFLNNDSISVNFPAVELTLFDVLKEKHQYSWNSPVVHCSYIF